MEEPLGSDDERPQSASEPSSPASSGEVAVLGRSDGSDSDQEEGETSDSSPEEVTRCVLTARDVPCTPSLLRLQPSATVMNNQSARARYAEIDRLVTQGQASGRAQAHAGSAALRTQRQGSVR